MTWTVLIKRFIRFGKKREMDHDMKEFEYAQCYFKLINVNIYFTKENDFHKILL